MNSDFNRFTHACVVIDLLTNVRDEDIIKVLVEEFVINVWTDVLIDTLSEVYIDVTIDIVSDIGVAVLTGASANVLVAAMTDLGFATSAPSEESVSSC